MKTKTDQHCCCWQPYDLSFFATFSNQIISSCCMPVLSGQIWLIVSVSVGEEGHLISFYFTLSRLYNKYIIFLLVSQNRTKSILACPKLTSCCIFFSVRHCNKMFFLLRREHSSFTVCSRWSVLLPPLQMTEAEQVDFKRLLLLFLTLPPRRSVIFCLTWFFHTFIGNSTENSMNMEMRQTGDVTV